MKTKRSTFSVAISQFPFVLACVALILAAFAPGASASGVNNAESAAVVTAGRVAGDDRSARFYIDLDREIDFDGFLMGNPARVVIDGPSMLFRFDNPGDLDPRGMIDYVRYGAISRERSRIVVTLGNPAKIDRMEIEPLPGGEGFRLTVDLSAVSEKAFAELVRRQQEEIGKTGVIARKGDRVRPEKKAEGRFRVVLDPGHGGIDGGAKGTNGTREKDITLAVARLMAEEIRSQGAFDVELTRDSDVFRSLRERVEFARRHHADLVISIHADSLRQKWVRGASVYTLSREASDHLAAQLASSENMVDIVAGLENTEEQEVVSGILAEFTARETKRFSRSFSDDVVDNLSSDIQLLKNPKRSANFAVLRAPEVPGVLIELGYLSNKEDEELLTDPEWQKKVAELLAKSVRSFFQPRF